MEPLRCLPEGIISRSIPVNDLDMHILEAGDPSAPLLLLLHGFPELAFSWRKVIVPLAETGYHVVAPDQRGYGRTTVRGGSSERVRYEDDLRPYTMFSGVRDVVALVFALGYRTVAAVIGHDFGSAAATFSTLIRPDIFASLVIMSVPYVGPPPLPFAVDRAPSGGSAGPTGVFPNVDAQLATLDPPQKHYTAYFSGPTANADIVQAPQGLREFLRAYFHAKSGDWAHNDPHPLPSANAAALAVMPWYYIMPLELNIAEAAQHHTDSVEGARTGAWLAEEELEVFAEEYGRTGFQGGLNRYRCVRDAQWMQDLTVFAGRKIDVPAMYLAGAKDWGLYQNPGGLDKMQSECTRMDKEDVVFVEGAGHWVQQENPEEVVHHILRFLRKVDGR